MKQLTENLILLQSREDLRLELGRHAVRRMREEFSLDSMAKNYDRVYSSLAPSAAGAKRLARWRAAGAARKLDKSGSNSIIINHLFRACYG